MAWVMHGMLKLFPFTISRRAAPGQLVQQGWRCSSISNPQPASVRAR